MLATGTASLTLALLFPVFAAAATTTSQVAVRTQQILQGSPTTCAPLDVRNVNPYIYDGALHSFDVTIDDASYVSIGGLVGNSGIPLNYMTRRANLDGTLTIHIDLNITPIRGQLPVSLTLLSAAKPQSVCAAVLSFALTGPTTSISKPSTQYAAPAAPVKPTAPTKPVATSTTSSSGPVVGSMGSNGFRDSLTSACIAAGPYQLWFILLALFMVAVGLTAFAEPPLAKKHATLPVALILVPLVLLLGFWYLALACRVATWIPFVLMIAAAIGLVTAFRDEEMSIVPAIQLPQAIVNTKKEVAVTEKTTVTQKAIITPPPAKGK